MTMKKLKNHNKTNLILLFISLLLILCLLIFVVYNNFSNIDKSNKASVDIQIEDQEEVII